MSEQTILSTPEDQHAELSALTAILQQVPDVGTFSLRDSLLVSTKASLSFLLSRQEEVKALMEEIKEKKGELENASFMRMTDSAGSYAIIDNNNVMVIAPNLCCALAYYVSRFKT